MIDFVSNQLLNTERNQSHRIFINFNRRIVEHIFAKCWITFNIKSKVFKWMFFCVKSFKNIYSFVSLVWCVHSAANPFFRSSFPFSIKFNWIIVLCALLSWCASRLSISCLLCFLRSCCDSNFQFSTPAQRCNGRRAAILLSLYN